MHSENDSIIPLGGLDYNSAAHKPRTAWAGKTRKLAQFLSGALGGGYIKIRTKLDPLRRWVRMRR
jgi:hypothetical protein